MKDNFYLSAAYICLILKGIIICFRNNFFRFSLYKPYSKLFSKTTYFKLKHVVLENTGSFMIVY
jgi:hypothetical protein